MEKEWNVLVVSPLVHHRNFLLNAFRGLPVNAFIVTTSQQAREMLAALSFALVFCEENIPDGSYRDLLSLVRAARSKIRFIVLLSTGDWEAYLEALRLGVTDAIASPLEIADIEAVTVRTLRNEPDTQALRASA